MNQEELKNLRVELNLTQEHMAFLCGVTIRTYRKWEQTEIPKFVENFLDLLKYENNRKILSKNAMQRLIYKK